MVFINVWVNSCITLVQNVLLRRIQLSGEINIMIYYDNKRWFNKQYIFEEKKACKIYTNVFIYNIYINGIF